MAQFNRRDVEESRGCVNKRWGGGQTEPHHFPLPFISFQRLSQSTGVITADISEGYIAIWQGMKQPEGRSQPFGGSELLNRDHHHRAAFSSV